MENANPVLWVRYANLSGWLDDRAFRTVPQRRMCKSDSIMAIDIPDGLTDSRAMETSPKLGARATEASLQDRIFDAVAAAVGPEKARDLMELAETTPYPGEEPVDRGTLRRQRRMREIEDRFGI